MNAEIVAHIANLGKYAAGTLTDTVLSFPATTEQVENALQEIGVDGLRYQEILVTDYAANIPGVIVGLSEYPHLDELNYLSCRIQFLTSSEQEKFSAALCHGEYAGTLQDMINLTYNLDCYDLLSDIKSYEDYGRYLVEIGRDFLLPDQAKYYFDYAQYGEDSAINEGGELTPQGYIFNNQCPFQTVYDGKNVPRQYRVFLYPVQTKVKSKHKSQHGETPIR